MSEEEDEGGAAGNERPFTPPPDAEAPPPPRETFALPPTDGAAGQGRKAQPPAAAPDDKEHAYRAGARITPAALSRHEREWRGLPASQWEQRKSGGRYAARHLSAAGLEAALKARKGAAARRARGAALRSLVEAEAARGAGDSADAAAADAAARASLEDYFDAEAGARHNAGAPSRGGGGGKRGLAKAHALVLRREGLEGRDLGEAHPHFRQALLAQGLRKDSVTPSRPRAETLRRCKAEVGVGAEETRYAVRAAARRAQPEWHREAHRLAARCEAKRLPNREKAERGQAAPQANRRPISAPPKVAAADGRWPLGAADGRWRAAGRSASPEGGEGAGSGRGLLLPDLIVFSCDETLWPGELWMASSGPPYRPAPNETGDGIAIGAVLDAGGATLRLRPEALRVLREVTSVWPQRRGVSRLCFASAAPNPRRTEALLQAIPLRASASMSALAGGIAMCGAESIKPASAPPSRLVVATVCRIVCGVPQAAHSAAGARRVLWPHALPRRAVARRPGRARAGLRRAALCGRPGRAVLAGGALRLRGSRALRGAPDGDCKI